VTPYTKEEELCFHLKTFAKNKSCIFYYFELQNIELTQKLASIENTSIVKNNKINKKLAKSNNDKTAEEMQLALLFSFFFSLFYLLIRHRQKRIIYQLCSCVRPKYLQSYFCTLCPIAHCLFLYPYASVHKMFDLNI